MQLMIEARVPYCDTNILQSYVRQMRGVDKKHSTVELPLKFSNQSKTSTQNLFLARVSFSVVSPTLLPSQMIIPWRWYT